MINETAYDLMSAAEREYLLANGWIQDDPEKDEWRFPTPRVPERNRPITQDHAVNVQKQHDRQWLQMRRLR